MNEWVSEWVTRAGIELLNILGFQLNPQQSHRPLPRSNHPCLAWTHSKLTKLCRPAEPSSILTNLFLFQRLVLEIFYNFTSDCLWNLDWSNKADWLWFVLLILDSISDDINPHSPHNTKIHTITLIQAFPGFLALLAPTGALVLMMVYYIYMFKCTVNCTFDRANPDYGNTRCQFCLRVHRTLFWSN